MSGHVKFLTNDMAKTRMLAISSTATMHIVETAEADLEFAIDLFRVYMASAAWLRTDYGEMIKRTVVRSPLPERDELLDRMLGVMIDTQT